MGVEMLGQRLQQGGALVEGQAPEERAADPAGVIEHGGEIGSAGADLGDDAAGHRAPQLGDDAPRRQPFAGGVALQEETRHRREPPRGLSSSAACR